MKIGGWGDAAGLFQNLGNFAGTVLDDGAKRAQAQAQTEADAAELELTRRLDDFRRNMDDESFLSDYAPAQGYTDDSQRYRDALSRYNDEQWKNIGDSLSPLAREKAKATWDQLLVRQESSVLAYADKRRDEKTVLQEHDNAEKAFATGADAQTAIGYFHRAPEVYDAATFAKLQDSYVARDVTRNLLKAGRAEMGADGSGVEKALAAVDSLYTPELTTSGGRVVTVGEDIPLGVKKALETEAKDRQAVARSERLKTQEANIGREYSEFWKNAGSQRNAKGLIAQRDRLDAMVAQNPEALDQNDRNSIRADIEQELAILANPSGGKKATDAEEALARKFYEETIRPLILDPTIPQNKVQLEIDRLGNQYGLQEMRGTFTEDLKKNRAAIMANSSGYSAFRDGGEGITGFAAEKDPAMKAALQKAAIDAFAANPNLTRKDVLDTLKATRQVVTASKLTDFVEGASKIDPRVIGGHSDADAIATVVNKNWTGVTDDALNIQAASMLETLYPGIKVDRKDGKVMTAPVENSLVHDILAGGKRYRPTWDEKSASVVFTIIDEKGNETRGLGQKDLAKAEDQATIEKQKPTVEKIKADIRRGAITSWEEAKGAYGPLGFTSRQAVVDFLAEWNNRNKTPAKTGMVE